MPTTKSDLIDELSDRLRLPKGKAELIVNCIFDSMTRALQHDERIEIRGFGSFEVRSYKSYEGRNPRTGDTVHVAPKKLPFFKVGKELRERINGERDDARTNGYVDREPARPAASPADGGYEDRAEADAGPPDTGDRSRGHGRDMAHDPSSPGGGFTPA